MTIKEEVFNKGYVFLKDFLPNQTTQEVACTIGLPLPYSDGHIVHQLVPKAAEQDAPNTYSGNYGYGQFPLHTDQANWLKPARYLLLRCQLGSDSVTTSLFDGNLIVNAIGENVLSRGLVRPRRPINNTFPLLRLYQQHEPDNRLFRWDELYLVPASIAGSIAMTGVKEYLSSVQRQQISLGKAADTLIVDNWRMLHGRSSIPINSKRVIDRAYLEHLN